MRVSPLGISWSLFLWSTVAAAGEPLKIKLARPEASSPGIAVMEKRKSPVAVNLSDYFNKSDLQWYGTVSVGTPPQDLTVLFDTGSTDIVLPKIGCTTCSNHVLFDPYKSTSFSSLPGYNLSIDYGTGGNAVPLSESQPAIGSVVTDTVTLNGLSVANQTFLLCDQYAPALNALSIDGIFGLAPPNSSRFSTQGNHNFLTWFWNAVEQGALPEPIFSLLLNSRDSELQGELMLGGVDSSSYRGDIKKIDFNRTISTIAGEWFIDSPYFYINGNIVNNSISGAPFPFSQSLVDSGTAFIQTPDYQTAKDIYAAISTRIVQIDELGAWGAPCDIMETLRPDLTFTLGTGSQALNLSIPIEAFNLGEYSGQPGICQAVFLNPVEPISKAATLWVLGSPLLKAYYTVWDGENMQFGVADLPTSTRNGTNTQPPSATPTPNSGGSVVLNGVYITYLFTILTMMSVDM